MSKTEAELIQLRAENDGLRALLAQHDSGVTGRWVIKWIPINNNSV